MNINPLRKLAPVVNAVPSNAVSVGEGGQPEGVSFSMKPDDYELGNPIGYGSSAMVYIAKYLPLQKIVAVKVLDLDMFERNQIDELRREIQIMSLSRHPNLLPVYGSFVNGPKLFIVTPFLSAGSLLDIMKTAYPHGIDEQCIVTILKQALQGLEYLHKNGLIHRDVKAGNLLMDEDGLVQLADFGVSSSLMETGERKGNRKTFVGTPCWMAPEVMEQSGYDYKADIWSFGITALELSTGHAPFAKYPPLKVMMMTLQNEPPTLDRDQTYNKYSKSFKDLIDCCLQKDPTKRPTAEKLLQHPFFKLATKKRQHLATDLLQALPPITRRAHVKKPFPRFQEDIKGMSWDFSSSSESENSPDSFKLPPDLTIIPESTAPYRPGSSMSGMPLGYKSSPLASTEVLQSDAQPAAASVSPNFCQEIKKGRFSVTEQQETGGGTTPMSDTSSAPSVASPANEGRQKFNVLSIHSDSSNMASPVMSAGESASSPKASRFTVTANESLPPSSVPVVSNDKRSRFEVHSVSDPSTGPAETSPTPSPHPSMGRTSRFAKSVISDSDSQPNTEDLQEKLNTIQRQNLEQQKLLSELVGAMTAAGMSVGGAEGSEALKAIQQKVEQQRKQQLQSSSEDDVSTLIQENRRLREENEALRLRQDALEKKP